MSVKSSDKLKIALFSLKPIAYIAGGIACAYMAAKSAYDVGAYEGIKATMKTSIESPELFEEAKTRCIEYNEIEEE